MSAIPNPKRLVVRCDVGQGSGTARAYVEGKAPGTCKITGLSDSRERYSATVDGVKAKEYTCFAGESQTCE